MKRRLKRTNRTDHLPKSPRQKTSEVRTTVVAEAAEKLRELILRVGDGAYLGSQDDLIRKLGVARATFLQTSRLLERERLLTVRRGVAGGYFARLPDEVGVEEAVATYLRANKANFMQVYPIVRVLNMEMARLACRSHDDALMGALQAIAKRIEAVDLTDSGRTPGELATLDTAFLEATCDLAGNPFGKLILLVTVRLRFSTYPQLLLPTEADREVWRRSRLNAVRAILDHDEFLAESAYKKLSQILEARMDEYAAADGAPAAPRGRWRRRATVGSD